MKVSAISILAFAAIAASAEAFAQSGPTTFVIDNKTYYLHPLAYYDLSTFDPADAMWNQNIVADNQYIYLADHTDNSADHLTIKRYNAIDGTPADNLVINEQELIKYDIDLDTDEYERCFSLVKSNDEDYLVLFLNISPEKNLKSNSNIKFYLIDKSGHIEREFIGKTSNIDSSFMRNEIADFGIPEFIGNVAHGDFDMLLPMINGIGYMTTIKFSFKSFTHSGASVVLYDYSQKKRFTKPSVHVIDGSYMIIDDIGISPTIYSYTNFPNQSFGELDNHINAHGCDWFDFDGHRLLYSGDIKYDENDTQNGITQFNIGLWDTDNIGSISSSDNTAISFDNYTPLATLGFGQSTINTKELYPYAYRQFMAVSDYGNATKHLHFYVPGEFLSTYQLNKYEIPTDVENICIYENQPVGYLISDKNLIFDLPISEVYVFNMTGTQIFHSETPVKSINLANFVKGTYIVATPHKSFKIIL